MTKKIMAVFVTVMMCLSLCGMMSVSAEETGGTILFGDVNLDGKVSVLDVITISKYNAEIITLNEDQLLAADCDADGVVSLNDVDSLMNCLVENITELPAEVKAREREYFETHTFEEFLALSEEEIRAISEELAYTYSSNEYYYECNCAMTGGELLNEQYVVLIMTDQYVDALYGEAEPYVISREQMFSDLKFPEALDISGYEGFIFDPMYYMNCDIVIDADGYSAYTHADIVASACAWFTLNPNIAHVSMSVMAA